MLHEPSTEKIIKMKKKKMALKAKYVTLILCQAIGPEINKSKIPENTLNMSRPITTG